MILSAFFLILFFSVGCYLYLSSKTIFQKLAWALLHCACVRKDKAGHLAWNSVSACLSAGMYSVFHLKPKMTPQGGCFAEETFLDKRSELLFYQSGCWQLLWKRISWVGYVYHSVSSFGCCAVDKLTEAYSVEGSSHMSPPIPPYPTPTHTD